jgi:hypothetical protein
MSWKNQPEQSGVYYIRVYNQSTRYWKHIASDNNHWIKLESLQNDDRHFKASGNFSFPVP